MFFPLSIMLEMNDLRTFMFATFKEPEQGWNKVSDFWITIVSAFVIKGLSHFIEKLLWNYFYIHCKEVDDEKVRRAKTKKAANSFF